MKTATALLFASVAAAHEAAYTTVYPGHGKGPVTVTEQFQPVPTWAHGKWSEYECISTVFEDAWDNKITVTKTDQPVTVYHHKTTITHTSAGYGGYAKPTGYWGGGHKSNYTAAKTWYELDEEIHEVPYNHVGPHAIPGYAGNPRCTDPKDDQVVTIKTYHGGKWQTYPYTFHYGVPKPSVTTYDQPGTYTIPAQDLTVDHPTALPTVATTKATANQPCTYGGVTTDVSKPTTITATYGAYQTHGATTKTVVVTKTVTCDKPGKYTIVKPTTTVYAHDTTVTFPTVTNYPPGVYHHSKTTVTITKPHQPYTCTYQQTKTYPEPTKHTPTHKPSSTHSGYPEPTHKTSSSHGGYPEPTHTKSHHTSPHPTHTPSSTSTHDGYPEPTHSKPHHTKPHHTKPHHTKPHHTKTSTAANPDPSSDYEEPSEPYGHPSSGYVKRGGVLERRKAEEAPKKIAKRVILV